MAVVMAVVWSGRPATQAEASKGQRSPYLSKSLCHILIEPNAGRALVYADPRFGGQRRDSSNDITAHTADCGCRDDRLEVAKTCGTVREFRICILLGTFDHADPDSRLFLLHRTTKYCSSPPFSGSVPHGRTHPFHASASWCGYGQRWHSLGNLSPPAAWRLHRGSPAS